MDRDKLIDIVSGKMKLVRTEANLSQDEMAGLLGISKKTLLQIEKGRVKAGWSVAVTFCTLFRSSEIMQGIFGDELLEVVSIIAFQKYEAPKEKTMGGKVWWREVNSIGDFRLQQNLLSQHYRILDQNNRRWFSSFDKDYMETKLFELSSKRLPQND